MEKQNIIRKVVKRKGNIQQHTNVCFIFLCFLAFVLYLHAPFSIFGWCETFLNFVSVSNSCIFQPQIFGCEKTKSFVRPKQMDCDGKNIHSPKNQAHRARTRLTNSVTLTRKKESISNLDLLIIQEKKQENSSKLVLRSGCYQHNI